MGEVSWRKETVDFSCRAGFVWRASVSMEKGELIEEDRVSGSGLRKILH